MSAGEDAFAPSTDEGQMGRDRFKMPDLLDYEAQIARDTLTEPHLLMSRDRDLKKKLPTGDRTRTILAWTRNFQVADYHSAGATAQRSYDVFVFAAIVLGFLSGTALIQ